MSEDAICILTSSRGGRELLEGRRRRAHLSVIAVTLVLVVIGGAAAAAVHTGIDLALPAHDSPDDHENGTPKITYEWQNASSMTIARASPAVVTLKDGSILVTGGITSAGTPTATTEVFDQARGQWKPGPTMQSKRVGHTATLLLDGTVLIAGGETGSGSSASAELLNITSSSSISLPSMSFARAAHAALLLPNGKVLVTGGSDFSTATWRQAELYDPAGHKWLPAGNMARARVFLTVQMLPGGDALVIGGDPDGTSEKYSSSANLWSGLSTMTAKRASSGSMILGDGRVLVAGGLVNGTALSSAEIFTPSTSKWSATGSMSVGRAGFSLTPLLTGDVLAAGSKSNAGTTSSAELFHPGNGTWTPAQPMHRSRGAQGYAVTTNGTIFEIGGWSGNSITASTEAYSPVPVKKPELCRPIDIVPLVQAAKGLRGGSANGLIAKLEAAQQKFDAKEFGTCINIMNAFSNQVGAYVRSGHISNADAVILYDAYSSVVRCIGGTPLPAVSATSAMLLRSIF